MLRERLGNGQFVITMEVDPPRGANPWPVYEKIKQVAPLLTAANIADCPTAKMRMSPIALAHLIQDQLDLETIFHLTCRDRNILGLQAELLGAWAMGVKNILTVTGDHPNLGDHPEASAVYDVDSSGLARLASNLNAGCDYYGNPLEDGTQLFIGAVANPAVKDLAIEKSRIEKKIANGVQFFQTQPIYSLEQLHRFQEEVQPSVPVIYGIMPLKGVKQAQYLNSKVPGVHVPKDMVDLLEKFGEEAVTEQLTEMILTMKKEIAGVHLFPMGKYERILGLLEAIK